jgi:hypothetical protein
MGESVAGRLGPENGGSAWPDGGDGGGAGEMGGGF